MTLRYTFMSKINTFYIHNKSYVFAFSLLQKVTTCDSNACSVKSPCGFAGWLSQGLQRPRDRLEWGHRGQPVAKEARVKERPSCEWWWKGNLKVQLLWGIVNRLVKGAKCRVSVPAVHHAAFPDILMVQGEMDIDRLWVHRGRGGERKERNVGGDGGHVFTLSITWHWLLTWQLQDSLL